MDKVYKVYLRMHNSNNSLIKKIYHYWLRVIYACDIMPQAKIGEGTTFPHCGLGVVINEDAVIGTNCKIGKGVVIGGRNQSPIVPVIGNNVEIGVNALILGSITIGAGAIIGAGSVVLHDVPEYAVAVGNPAKVIKYNNKMK